jgi:periplasmic protein TonB
MDAVWPELKMFRWRHNFLKQINVHLQFTGSWRPKMKELIAEHRSIVLNRWSWLQSVFLAVLMTALLFVVLPLILHPESPVKQSIAALDQISVIRLPRLEPDVKREPVRPQMVKPKSLKVIPKQANPQFKPENLMLPFAINPQLPGNVVNIDIPAVQATDLIGGLELPEVFSIGDLDQPLVTLSRQAPLYPPYASRHKIEGEVRVRFIVNSAGRVENIQIVAAHPAEIFDESVIRCVSAWRFKPGTVEGIAVKSWVETTIKFVLKSR